LEVRIAENSGMMNIGMPSIIIKMLRQKFDQQWSVRRGESTETERARLLRLVKPALLHLDARLEGPTLQVGDLMRLKTGDVLAFDYPVNRPVNFLVNGKLKFRGQVGSTGRKRAFVIEERPQPAE
jgi:flagellar motor switch protein FliM